MAFGHLAFGRSHLAGISPGFLYILAGDAGWELRVCPFLFPFPLYITLEFL